LFEGRNEIHCIEYPLREEEALQFIISHHQLQRGWNDFIRIRLALKLEPYFQQNALHNIRIGGKYKGSTNLSEADRINVCQKIAKLAGTGTGNVRKVKAMGRIEATNMAYQRSVRATNPAAARGNSHICYSLTNWCLALVCRPDPARLCAATRRRTFGSVFAELAEGR